MKKGIIIATIGLLATVGSTAQDISTYTPGLTEEGVVYYLPKTEITLQVSATHVTYTPGEFCQYADRYLRLKNISAEPKEYWEINGIRVEAVGVPDAGHAYVVRLKDKNLASNVRLTSEGILHAVNTDAPASAKEAPQASAPAKRPVDPRSFMTEEILQTSSTAKMAELVAREIYNIRESKNSLTRGQADYMPTDGAALQLMLTNLEEQETALTQMFSGITTRTTKEFTIRVAPEEVKDKVAFRFSKKLGMLKADDLAGEPCYISIANSEALPTAAPEAKEKKLDGIVYRIPGKAQVSVSFDGKNYFDGELPVAQFGAIEVLVNSLFGKKANTRVIFDPNTGNVVKIDKDLE